MSLSASRNLCDELTAAVHSKNVDRLSELVRQGADLNITLSEGLLPLVLAANNCDFETCKVLLRLGAKLDSSGGVVSHETPLSISVRAGLVDAVATLIELGSDVNVTVDLCTERLSADSFQLYPGSTVLQSAIFRRNLPIIRRLVDAGADVNRADCSGNTALHLACLDGDDRAVDTVAMLLSLNRGSRAACRRTDIDASNCHGQTPLMLAAGRSSELVRLLLKERPAPVIEAKDRRHKTALHYAAEAGLEDATLMLLRAGCHVDGSKTTNTQSVTPLHVAAHSGKVHICRVLLDFGANPLVHTFDGNTILHQAASSMCGWNGSTDILEQFISVGLQIDGKNSAGYTPLAVAASCGNLTVARFLIDVGARLNEPGNNGMTPLSLSINGAHCRISQMLIVEGANPNSGSVRLDLHSPYLITLLCNNIFEVVLGHHFCNVSSKLDSVHLQLNKTEMS